MATIHVHIGCILSLHIPASQRHVKFCCLLIELYPRFLEELSTDHPLGHVELGLLMKRVIAKVDRLRFRLRPVVAPGFAPEPLLRQGEDRHLILGIIGQILIQIRQGIRVPAELVIRRPEPITHRGSSEASQVYHVQCRNMIRFVSEVLLPVPLPPELKPKSFIPG